MEKIKVGVVGATGYAGAEICRLIAGHPAAELAAISSVSFEGQALSDVYPAYREMCDLICTTQEAVVEKSDVIFAALPHGLSQELAAECDKKGKAFIDLGADFRLKSEEEYTEWYGGTFTDKALHEKAVYGLPELFREEIKKTKLVANPGCYTTAVPLALVPALEKGYIETTGIIANCASGVTGAGKKATPRTHFCFANENLEAYGVGSHRHTPEIEQILGKPGEVLFTPHLAPLGRGLLSTVTLRVAPGADVTAEGLQKLYEDFYRDSALVTVLPAGVQPKTSSVVGTARAHVGVVYAERVGAIVATGAIDNLCKGAAGQALQCANIVCGFNETCGLPGIGQPV